LSFCHFVILSFCHFVILSSLQASAAGESPAPQFDLHTADGVIASGRLEQVREDWSVSLSGTKAVRVEGKDLVGLRRSETPLPPAPREEHVVFTNGDQLPGTLLDLSGERIRFKARVGTDQELMLPLSAVSLLWFA